eukprot:TRINITY_DN40621_c0_g1_i3.p1 TRINITY_DN40621_c0_g1~~TRINITY_DN40621_c0_g1_i3.p1  ORF type:complete len:232 (-),score=25.29 TRINITY_DN40621_c0_g1_i3:67-762(-)
MTLTCPVRFPFGWQEIRAEASRNPLLTAGLLFALASFIPLFYSLCFFFIQHEGLLSWGYQLLGGVIEKEVGRGYVTFGEIANISEASWHRAQLQERETLAAATRLQVPESSFIRHIGRFSWIGFLVDIPALYLSVTVMRLQLSGKLGKLRLQSLLQMSQVTVCWTVGGWLLLLHWALTWHARACLEAERQQDWVCQPGHVREAWLHWALCQAESSSECAAGVSATVWRSQM